MREHGAELFAWPAEGAHFYVCGDATDMARTSTWRCTRSSPGTRMGRRRDDYVAAMRKEKRYVRDVDERARRRLARLSGDGRQSEPVRSRSTGAGRETVIRPVHGLALAYRSAAGRAGGRARPVPRSAPSSTCQ